MYKSMYKSKLAKKAGVSPRTFSRWLQKHRSELETFGVGANTHLLPPRAVKYICEEYGIVTE